MFTKLEFNPRISRKTVAEVHRYLFDFGKGAHRVFWVGDRAYVETDCPTDVVLLREQFPELVGSEMDPKPGGFPW